VVTEPPAAHGRRSRWSKLFDRHPLAVSVGMVVALLVVFAAPAVWSIYADWRLRDGERVPARVLGEEPRHGRARNLVQPHTLVECIEVACSGLVAGVEVDGHRLRAGERVDVLLGPEEDESPGVRLADASFDERHDVDRRVLTFEAIVLGGLLLLLAGRAIVVPLLRRVESYDES
jgi:hypothetical protein